MSERSVRAGRPRRIVAWVSGLLAVGAICAFGLCWRDVLAWYRFRSVFEYVGSTEEGDPNYRHRETGVLLRRAANAVTVHFEGRVSRGQEFLREISNCLTFRLLPGRPGRSLGGHGWSIWVGAPGREEEDFSFPVTPPFRGVNARDIAAWHFRNRDNSGPNDAGPKNVNAPGRTREFSFVLDAENHRRAEAVLHKLLWPGSTAELKRAWRKYETIEAGGGTLTITDMRMSNLQPGLQPRIEQMAFEVALRLSPKWIQRLFLSR